MFGLVFHVWVPKDTVIDRVSRLLTNVSNPWRYAIEPTAITSLDTDLQTRIVSNGWCSIVSSIRQENLPFSETNVLEGV
jgi:hypothetical protein